MKLEKEKLLSLWEEIQQRIRERFIVQGFNFHLKRRVSLTNLSKEVATAEVRGKSETFYVELHLSDSSKHRCSCPRNGQCRHVAALFFHVYTLCGRPEMLIQDFYKEVAKKQKSQTKNRRTEKRTSTSQDKKNDQVEQWHRIFAEKVIEARILNESDPRQLWENILTVLDNQTDLPTNEQLKPLYRFNIYIFIMHKVDQLIANTNSSSRSIDDGGQFEGSLKDMLEQSRLTLQGDGWQRFTRYVRHTLEQMTTGILQATGIGSNWFFLYQIFIVRAANNSRRLERERTRLSHILRETNLTKQQTSHAQMMLAYLELLEGKDEQALKWVASSGTRSHPFVMSVLQQLHAQQAWDRMAGWLQSLTHAQALSGKELTELNQYWKVVTRKYDDDGPYEQWLKSSLPRSIQLYSDYLFDKDRYVEWLELQMVRGLDLSQLNEQQLQQIEQSQPELLLPLYHQEIEQLILQRKRSTYKEAVERLVWLRTLYDQLDQQERFQLSVTHISDKFKPFQALREEMMKGNLL